MTPNNLAGTVVGQLVSRPQLNVDSMNAIAQQNAMLQMCRSLAWNSTTQAVPNGTATKLTFDTNVYDVSGAPNTPIHNPSSNPTRFTAAIKGVYLIFAQVAFVLSGGEYLQLLVLHNGGGFQPSPLGSTQPLTAGTTIVQVVFVIPLSPGDYVEFEANYYATGGAATTQNGITYGGMILLSRQ